MSSLEALVTEPPRPLFRSVFVKLVSIMLAMAFTLLVLVSVFLRSLSTLT